MAKFNTQNELGSTDPRDLLDNSQIADDYVNNKEVESVPDRFGVMRKTWFGMEAIFSRLISLLKLQGDAAITAIGWQELGDWSIGLTLSDRRQVVLFDGSWYKYLGDLNHTISSDSPTNDGGIWSIDNSSGVWVNIGDASIRNELANSSGFGLIGQVSSFSKLRQLTPTRAGQRVLLASWNEDTQPYGQSSFGGGEFIAMSGTSTDDGGFIAKVSDTWYWKRVKDANLATVLDFGAIPDGVTDCHDAIVNMYNWAQSKTIRYYRAIPSINFVAGDFYFSSIDLSGEGVQHFILKGPEVDYGYHAETNIISDRTDSPMLKIAARTVEISGFNVNGQNDYNPNNQGFLDNTSITGGTFYRISNMWWQNFGGLLLNINDTLDTKIDQWYAEKCNGGGFKIGYDNSTSGNWDHPTAVELTNFNIQSSTGKPFFQAPRCLQSIIRNGWIEKSYGGDLTDGHWYVECLSVENCQDYGTLSFKNSRLTEVNTNQVASNVLRGYEQSSAWQTSFQPGQSYINPFGITTLGSLGAAWQTTPYFIVNNTANDGWYNIGKLWLESSGDNFLIECLGEQGFNNAQTESNQTYNAGYGIAKINLKKQSNFYIRGSWFSEGTSAVQDVAIIGGSNSSAQVYVYVKAYSRVGIYCKSNVPGSNELTMIGGSRTSTKLNWQPVLNPELLSSLPSSAEKLKSRYSVNVFSADNGIYGGIGISSDGLHEVRTVGSSNYSASTSIAGYIPTYVNGVLVGLPYYNLTKK